MWANKETARVRRFADVFSFCNYSAFKELLYFEQNMVRGAIANFEQLADLGIENAAREGGHWNNLRSSFADIKQTIQAISL